MCCRSIFKMFSFSLIDFSLPNLFSQDTYRKIKFFVYFFKVCSSSICGIFVVWNIGTRFHCHVRYVSETMMLKVENISRRILDSVLLRLIVQNKSVTINDFYFPNIFPGTHKNSVFSQSDIERLFHRILT